jgi:hypothetical protein
VPQTWQGQGDLSHPNTWDEEPKKAPFRAVSHSDMGTMDPGTSKCGHRRRQAFTGMVHANVVHTYEHKESHLSARSLKRFFCLTNKCPLSVPILQRS